MIISRNGVSYDTSDGSEQPHEGSAERIQRSDREEINRWEDDGAGPHGHAGAAASVADGPIKPAWSVLSLRNLLNAIRLLRREPSEAVARQERQRAGVDVKGTFLILMRRPWP